VARYKVAIMMQLARRIGKWLGLFVLSLLLAGAVYQQIGLALDSRLAPPADQMVAVNGHSVHVLCMGQGPRSYVLDAGASAGTFEWWRLQPLLAKTGRACAFDRSGLGWSESSGGAHDGATAADELAALIRAAKIATPFVYVGHSLGANFATIYYARHPQDVSALVLIEPGLPRDLLEDFHGTRADAFAATDCGATCYAAGAATDLGVTRLAAWIMIKPGHSLSGPALDAYRAELGRASATMATAASLNALPKTAYEELDVHSFGDTPVLIFASSQPRPPEGSETIADVKKWRAGQLATFAALAATSTHGKGPITIPDSSHSSMVMGEHQSAAMAQAIADFLPPVRP
jgi:pimeloyl-ACP methyl ester carboxylesterase